MLIILLTMRFGKQISNGRWRQSPSVQIGYIYGWIKEVLFTDISVAEALICTQCVPYHTPHRKYQYNKD